MLTRKENLLRAIKRENPEWVPNGMEDSIRVYPPILERPHCTGKDAFGIEWILDIDAEGGTYPAHNGHIVTDLEKWEEQFEVPDVEQFD